MKIFGVELRFNGFRIYHEGDKPTPSEIGAAASNHTHTTMGAASASVAGKAGLVPAPPARPGRFRTRIQRLLAISTFLPEARPGRCLAMQQPEQPPGRR